MFTLSDKQSFSYKFIIALFLLGLVSLQNTRAQGKVTFKVNLTPQLEDSIFVSDRDKIYVQGNVFPLSKTKKVYLKDKAPVDSVFEASVNFSSASNGKRLAYKFVIVTPDKEIKEQMSHYIQLQSNDRELKPLYFDSFAW